VETLTTEQTALSSLRGRCAQLVEDLEGVRGERDAGGREIRYWGIAETIKFIFFLNRKFNIF